MPSSHPVALSFICGKILEYNPSRVLDVGIGFGKMGFLAREYTDIWKNKKYNEEDWETIIDGIEIFDKYISLHHRIIYDNIMIGDSTSIIKGMKADKIKYDMIICCDMLEHLEKEKGQEFLSNCNEISKHMIITTPKVFYKQDRNFYVTQMKNKHEIHKSVWTKDVLSNFGEVKEFGGLLLLYK